MIFNNAILNEININIICNYCGLVNTMLEYEKITRKGATKMSDQWVTMKEASRITGVSQSKLSRLAAIKAIEVRSHIVDRRIKLVNVEEIRRVFQIKQ